MGKTVPLLTAILFLAFFAGPAFARVNYVEFGGDDWSVSYQREPGGCYGYNCFHGGGYAAQYYPAYYPAPQPAMVVPVTTYVPAYRYAYNTYLPYAYPYYYPYYAFYYYTYPAYYYYPSYYPSAGYAATVSVVN